MNPAWALLRLASPQLPIGGYSYSQGLEMAVDNGRVTDPAMAARWIRDQLLLNLARFEAPLLLAHCQAAAIQDWSALQRLCDEHRASRETRLPTEQFTSRYSGLYWRSSKRWLEKISANPAEFDRYRRRSRE